MASLSAAFILVKSNDCGTSGSIDVKDVGVGHDCVCVCEVCGVWCACVCVCVGVYVSVCYSFILLIQFQYPPTRHKSNNIFIAFHT